MGAQNTVGARGKACTVCHGWGRAAADAGHMRQPGRGSGPVGQAGAHLEAVLEVGNGGLRVGGDDGHRVGGGHEEVGAQHHVAIAIAICKAEAPGCGRKGA